MENRFTVAKDLAWHSSAQHSPAWLEPGREKLQCCHHGAHSYCNPVDYCLKYFYLYLKDVYICKYEQKVAIILGDVQLLMLTDWGCHCIWCVCVFVFECGSVSVNENKR